jgi:hypothetical protein
MKQNSTDFLWEIVFHCWIAKDFKESKRIAGNFYNLNINVPVEIEASILEVAEGNFSDAICQVALYLVRNRSLSEDRHVILTGLLLQKGVFSIDEAANLLSGIKPIKSSSDITRKINHVIDVAWLVNEDSKDKVMHPGDDGLLRTAFEELASHVEGNNLHLT